MGGWNALITVITDSAADIPKEEAEKYGIRVLGIPLALDGKSYLEGVDLNAQEFYKLLAGAKELPTTAQVTPFRYREAFEEAAAQPGCTGIVCITINALGSGMYQGALLAREELLEDRPELEEKFTIDVVDSARYAYIYGHAVVDAARAASQGKNREEVLQVFHHRCEGYQGFFGLTNLEYAKRSGRITAAAAFVGEVMGFRPIMTIREGRIDTIAKVRGDKKLVEAMLALYQERRSGDGRGFYIIYAENKAMGQQLRRAIEKETKDKCLGEYDVGASVVINAGPTVFGVIAPVDGVR